VHLGLVQQEEERPITSDPVLGVLTVEACGGDPGLVQIRQTSVSTLPEFVEVAELDGFGGAGLGTGRFHAVTDPVVAQGALPGPSVLLPAVDDAVRAGGDAVPAAVADVLLDHDGLELGVEKGPGRTHVHTCGVGAAFTHVRGHEPAELTTFLGRGRGSGQFERRHAEVNGLTATQTCFLVAERLTLLDEGDVPPTVGVEPPGVVEGHAGEVQAVLGNKVPFLAGDLTGLTADTHTRVGEEPEALGTSSTIAAHSHVPSSHTGLLGDPGPAPVFTQ